MKSIFKQYVATNQIKNIPTYSLSQDPLELHFGKVRSKNGFNDNPNVQQYEAANRSIVAIGFVLNSKDGNCVPLKQASHSISKILEVSSRQKKTYSDENSNEFELALTGAEALYNCDFNEVDLGILQVALGTISIVHIANIIESNIKNRFNQFYCAGCVDVFNDEKVENAFLNSKFHQKPCKSTYDICWKYFERTTILN